MPMMLIMELSILTALIVALVFLPRYRRWLCGAIAVFTLMMIWIRG